MCYPFLKGYIIIIDLFLFCRREWFSLYRRNAYETKFSKINTWYWTVYPNIYIPGMPPCYLNPVHIILPKWGTYSIYIYIYMAVIKCILSLYLCIDKDTRNISSGLCSKCEAFASHLLQSSEDIVHMRRKFLAHTWQVPTPRWYSYQHRL